MIRRTILFALALATPAAAVPTDIVVRALSQGAKFIGTGMGGAEVVVSVPATGAVLARGQISGGTGDTQRIMAGSPRGTPLAGESAAAFKATVDLANPVLVAVQVRAPLNAGAQAITVTQQRWLIPGAPVQGDGWVLEIPGLSVSASAEGRTVTALVRMQCGCPIEPGGLWDAARFSVIAWQGPGTAPVKTALPFAGTTGTFRATLPAKGPTLLVASDSLTGATSVQTIEVP
jgi:hypothetical protein